MSGYALHRTTTGELLCATTDATLLARMLCVHPAIQVCCVEVRIVGWCVVPCGRVLDPFLAYYDGRLIERARIFFSRVFYRDALYYLLRIVCGLYWGDFSDFWKLFQVQRALGLLFLARALLRVCVRQSVCDDSDCEALA